MDVNPRKVRSSARTLFSDDGGMDVAVKTVADFKRSLQYALTRAGYIQRIYTSGSGIQAGYTSFQSCDLAPEPEAIA